MTTTMLTTAQAAPEAEEALVPPAPIEPSTVPTRPRRGRGRWVTAVIAAATGLLMLAAGIGIGYAANAGTRRDLDAANASISTLTAGQAAARSEATRCTAAATAAATLNAQWQTYADDIEAWFDTTSGSAEEETIAKRLSTEYTEIQRRSGQVEELIAQCTGSAS